MLLQNTFKIYKTPNCHSFVFKKMCFENEQAGSNFVIHNPTQKFIYVRVYMANKNKLKIISNKIEVVLNKNFTIFNATINQAFVSI